MFIPSEFEEDIEIGIDDDGGAEDEEELEEEIEEITMEYAEDDEGECALICNHHI